ncbi:hypothetical protein [Flavobacterium sp. AG291]|uniref:hypothetical protein n=1 Tax=Flavobacterium sp. AG291 TaxID=2184000 RepID=UPI000E0AFDD4|nr:hypothetical protein [Flavobacterium sp. AG291]RDI07040.1 hypothetical protein DEU42_113140 [Flavobacterium sp. AG291]
MSSIGTSVEWFPGSSGGGGSDTAQDVFERGSEVSVGENISLSNIAEWAFALMGAYNTNQTKFAEIYVSAFDDTYTNPAIAALYARNDLESRESSVYVSDGSVVINSDGDIIVNSQNQKGIQYLQDYSADYTERSLVDKEFVERQLNFINGYVGVYAPNFNIYTEDIQFYKRTFFEDNNAIGSDWYLPDPAENISKEIVVVSQGQSIKLHGVIKKGALLTELDVTVSATLRAFNNNGSAVWNVICEVKP